MINNKILKRSLAVGGLLFLVFPFVVLGIYFYQFPYLATEEDHWSAFGSLLSGVFALFGSLLTVLSLLFVYGQLKLQERMNVFDSYVKHRDLFFQKLDGLEKLRGIEFFDRDGFYQSIFSQNGPTFFEPLVLVDTKSNKMASYCDSYFKLVEQLAKTHSTSSVVEYVYRIIRLRGQLFFRTRPDRCLEGMVEFQTDTGPMDWDISAFNIAREVENILLVLNFVLGFTGNKMLDRGHIYFSEENKIKLVEALIKGLDGNGVHFKIKMSETSLALFELYFSLRDACGIEKGLVFDDYLTRLRGAIRSIESIDRYHSDLKGVAIDLYRLCEDEIGERMCNGPGSSLGVIPDIQNRARDLLVKLN